MKSLNYFFLISFICIASASAKEGSGEWVWPTYEIEGVVKKKTVIFKEKYNYVQSQVNDNAYIKYVIKRNSSYTSPESAVIARFSAIQALDFDWWFDSMDDVSKTLAKNKYKNEKLGKRYWQDLWEKQFVGNNIKVINKIQTGDYVIYTYKVFSNNKKDLSGGFEFPLVLKKTHNKWKVSLDLRADPLLVFSPWVSGKYMEIVSVGSI